MSPNLEWDILQPSPSKDHPGQTRLVHSERLSIDKQGTMQWNGHWLSPAGGNVDSGASVGHVLA